MNTQTLEQRLAIVEARLGKTLDQMQKLVDTLLKVDAPQTPAPAPVKDWEVVAFKNHRNSIFEKNERGMFCVVDWSEEQMINGCQGIYATVSNGKLSIHSVKRLSDGLVVTVGDRDEDLEFVKEFRIVENEMMVFFSTCEDEDCIEGHDIKIFKPFTPSFSFTTADGVVITNPEQIVYWVSKDNVASFGHIVIEFIASDKHLFFSTESARDNYRVLNAKCLSMNDVIDCFEHGTFDSLKAEELVKSRLK